MPSALGPGPCGTLSPLRRDMTRVHLDEGGHSRHSMQSRFTRKHACRSAPYFNEVSAVGKGMGATNRGMIAYVRTGEDIRLFHPPADDTDFITVHNRPTRVRQHMDIRAEFDPVTDLACATVNRVPCSKANPMKKYPCSNGRNANEARSTGRCRQQASPPRFANCAVRAGFQIRPGGEQRAVSSACASVGAPKQQGAFFAITGNST